MVSEHYLRSQSLINAGSSYNFVQHFSVLTNRTVAFENDTVPETMEKLSMLYIFLSLTDPAQPDLLHTSMTFLGLIHTSTYK